MTFVCKNCKSERVQQKMWVHVNTMQLVDNASVGSDDQWCENCEEHHPFLTKYTIKK